MVKSLPIMTAISNKLHSYPPLHTINEQTAPSSLEKRTHSVLKRSFSLSQLDTLRKEKPEAQEIKDRSGVSWDCIGRKATFYGYTYRFRLKDEYNNLSPHSDLEKRMANAHKIYSDLYPATEPRANFIYIQDPNVNLKQFSSSLAKEETDQVCLGGDKTPWGALYSCFSNLINRVLLNCHLYTHTAEFEFFRELGYLVEEKDNHFFLTLPDLKTIIGKWQELQEKYPKKKLPNFNIVSSEGIANDIDFVEGYIAHDALLSNGKEFVHDQMTHVQCYTYRLFRHGNTHQSKRYELLKPILSVYRTLHLAKRLDQTGIITKYWEELCVIPGIMTDLLFSGAQTNYMYDSIFQWINRIFESGRIRRYIQKRFPNQPNVISSMEKAWYRAERLVQEFDKIRKPDLCTKITNYVTSCLGKCSAPNG